MRTIYSSVLAIAIFGMARPLYAQPVPAPLPLRQAEEMAVRNHPRISAAELTALAAKQVTREVRSSFFPTITANSTSVGTGSSDTRIGAGALNNPAIFDRNAEGLMVSQLITDFGRTANLTQSARLRERAQQQNALATRADILMQVDTAYFRALGAQALLRVAQDTVESAAAP